VEHLAASTAYQARFDKYICESDEHVRRRVCLFKAYFPKISEAKMKDRIFVVQQIHNYSKTKRLLQNKIIQKKEPGRHFKTPVETL
jgi:hypothetical protein